MLEAESGKTLNQKRCFLNVARIREEEEAPAQTPGRLFTIVIGTDAAGRAHAGLADAALRQEEWRYGTGFCTVLYFPGLSSEVRSNRRTNSDFHPSGFAAPEKEELHFDSTLLPVSSDCVGMDSKTEFDPIVSLGMSCQGGENEGYTETRPRRTRLIETDLKRIKQEAGSESGSDIEKVVLGLDSEGEPGIRALCEEGDSEPKNGLSRRRRRRRRRRGGGSDPGDVYEDDVTAGLNIVSVKQEDPVPVDSVQIVSDLNGPVPGTAVNSKHNTPTAWAVSTATASADGTLGNAACLRRGGAAARAAAPLLSDGPGFGPAGHAPPRKIAAPWDHDDITALISVWGQDRFQAELSETFRNIQVFERIAAALRRMGVQRSAVQCRGKIKKLKQEHKRCRESLARGGCEHRAFRYYQQLERVLSRRRAPREPAGAQGGGPGGEEEEEETTRDSYFMSDPTGCPPLEPLAPPLCIPGPPLEPGTPTALEEAPSSSKAEAPAPTPTAPPKSQRRRRRRGAQKTTLTELLDYLRESDEKLLALQAEFMAAEREERQRDREAAAHDHALICGALHRLAEAFSGYLPSDKEIELD
ncbi:uncharacterized protein LOC121298563 [Polyodon spathula]|uniref:uncharacterized protein LOC121298563 n=1 Tax=Polyodon spathula TaxID=7913 RepID=UPI001B7F38DB|nr:uncharacterized protein LOC121298563 [Polyodon spathula]